MNNLLINIREARAMSLPQELGFPNPIVHPAHEALLGIALTGALLAKECDRELAPFGVTAAQFNVLMLLLYQSRDGALSQTRLGRMLVVNRSNVTGLVDRMEKAGLVERVAKAGDRRVKRVRLTEAGRLLTRRAEKAYLRRTEQLVGAVPPGELRAMTRALEGIRRQIRKTGGGD